MELVGQYLKKHRNYKKIGISKISKELNISKFIVESIENNDFSADIGNVYWIGYIRSYAKLLQLNEKELAASGVEGYKTIDSGEEAKMRKHQMGHSNEKSGDVYNKRHITKKANEQNIQEQEELNAAVAREQSKKLGGSDE